MAKSDKIKMRKSKGEKCYTCGVTWCVSTKEDFIKWKADEIVSDPK